MIRMTTAVLASLTLLCLTACSPDDGANATDSAPAVIETPMPVLTLPPSPAEDRSTMSLADPQAQTLTEEEVREHSRDCVMAAAGLASIALAPSAFIYGADAQKLKELEGQLEEMETQVPDELKPHVVELETVVSENLSDPHDFHAEEYREALRPLELWVRNHCQR